MSIIRAQVELTKDSGLTEDSAVNVWHFTGTVGATDGAKIAQNLEDFYVAIDANLSSELTGNGIVKCYEVVAGPSGPPFYQETITFIPGSSNPLPSEVAVCLSYQAAQVVGLDQRNRRGRIFLGPLNVAVATTTAPCRPVASELTTIATAADALMTDCAADNVPWVVYSPTLGSSAPVTNGWVDNAFDTQRRRGVAATSRTLWS